MTAPKMDDEKEGAPVAAVSSEAAAVAPDDLTHDPVVGEASGAAVVVEKTVNSKGVDKGKDSSAIAQFFDGRSVFVTGGSGFLGKALVEKLLRSCPGISDVYLLLRRGRKGEEQSQRLRKLLSESPFTDLKERCPEALAKIHAVAGDVSAPGLGLSVSDRSLLSSKVSVVFHSAANITFNACMVKAVATNLQGTRRVVQLCKDLPKLECMVYVSTAFCNCGVKGPIAEKVLPAPCDPKWLADTVEGMDPKVLKETSRTLLFGHPNTYTLTKLLAEKSIEKERGSIPVAIVRPSIVMGALEEPVPGWVDNVNGASSFLAGALYGVIRGIHAVDEAVADLVPSDLVVNQIIAAAWDIAQRSERSEGEESPLEVYHCTSGQVNPVTWGEFTELAVEKARSHPCKGVLFYPAGKCRRSTLRNSAAVAMLHTFPARILQLLLELKGDPTGSRLVRLQNAYTRGMHHSRFVTTGRWSFAAENSAALSRRLVGADRIAFASDTSAIRWPDYLERCALGLRQFYFKESPETLPEARRSVGRLRWIYVAAQVALFLLAFAVGAWATGRCGAGALFVAVAIVAGMRAL